MSSHFIFLGGAVAVVPVLVGGRHGGLRRLARAVTAVGVSLLANAYLFVSFRGPKRFSIGAPDLAAFRTRGDPRLGLLVNVAGLNGFWREGPRLPKNDFPGWPIALAAVLAVCVVGFLATRGAGTKHNPPPTDAVRARSAVVLAVIGVIGALGDQGPTGGVYRFAFVHLPGFEIMREPGKWSALSALGYAVLFALGVRHLVARELGRADGSKRAAALMAVVGLVLPLVSAPSLAWGLDGRVRVSQYPSSWAAANREMGDRGSGSILFLPWHAYLAFDFTNGRTIANPAAGYFARSVIQGDNIEVGTRTTNVELDRSRYIEFCLAHGSETHAFGALVAPLGVEFVVLARGVDTADANTYDWLRQQGDLVPFFQGHDIEVWRNTRWRPTAVATAKPRIVSNWGAYFGGVNAGSLDPFTTTVRRLAPGPIVVPAAARPSPTEAVTLNVGAYSTTLRAHLRAPGTVATEEPWDPSWKAPGYSSRESAGGSVTLSGGAGVVAAGLRAWRTLRLAYFLSSLTYILVLTSLTFKGASCLLKRRAQLSHQTFKSF
jgi:hypothetical protein